uniref:Uncharacterized protein n=1 Tax=Globodera rostochiensis TaxID=31243 RepID=A0A914GQ60_GLORO
MSDNESDEEQQQQMEGIFICADVWHGVFAFLDPFELGLKMALISDRLDVLVDVHFKSREWSLGSLHICSIIGGNGAEIFNERSGGRLPIPQGPIPNKVIGFKCIQICYIDQTVVEFLRRFRRLFDSFGTNIHIATNDDESRSWQIIWQKIWPLVNDNICSFPLVPFHFKRLRQFSPSIFRNCPNLRSINSYGLLPEFPAEDNAEASSAQAVANWLITPRGDGLPKMLRCGFYSARMDGLKGAFVNASESANFIISFWHFSTLVIEPFELANALTRERLTLRRFNNDFWLLVRCPIGREEDKWTKWEEEAIEWLWYRQWNRLIVSFDDNGIGDGMIDANESPSELADGGIW